MPRLSSLRPLRSLASSGLVLSACLFGAGVASFAQPPSSSYPSSDYGGYGQQDPNALQNVPSGIKRSDVSSVVPLQALLYGDVTAVARVNFAKVDYVGLNEFVETVVDKGVGSLKSGDRYRDQLRDWQKGDLKAAVKSFLVEAQNIATKKFFANKIDEAYVLVYDLDGSDSTVALAFPTDGLSDADVKTLVDYIGSWEENKPIATFNRFGFVVAVTTHRNAVSVNVKEIENGYRNRALTEGTQGQGAGNYGGAANYASSGYAGYGSQNANGLPENLQREMTAEIKAAREDARTESIKKCGAAIKARFQKPAEAGSPVFDALKQTDGAALAIVLASNDLSGLKEKLAPAKTETPESVLAGSFADADSDAEKKSPFLTDFVDKVNPLEGLGGFKTLTLAASLVGSPKLAVVAAFDSPEKAKASADAFNGALTAGKLTAPVLLAEQMKTSGDLKPLIDVLFDALKPQTAGSKVAVVLDLNVFKENPTALLPLFGGVESKTTDEQEADVWDAVDDATDEEEAPADEAAPVEDATEEEVDEDDPFADEAAPAEDATEEEADEDDPFADEEEDPFA